MRVVVDALAARTGGGLTYLRSLLPAALAADGELELTVVVSRPDVLSGLIPQPRVTVVELPSAERLARRLAWEQTGLDALCRAVDADLLFAPSEIAPLRVSKPLLVGLQNPNLFAPDSRESPRQRARFRLLRAAARAAVRRADAVVFVSDAFRRAAEPLLPSTGAPRHTVTVGIDPRFEPAGGAGRFEALQPYVLCVSDVYAYKEIPVAVDAFARLAGDRADLRLVLAGSAAEARESARIDDRIARRGLGERVVRLGAVPYHEMPELYRGAACFIFPSVLESLGLPPLEALASGVPVVAARASVMPDVLDSAAMFFPPGDAVSAATLLDAALDGGHAGEEIARARANVLARHDPQATGAALAAVLRSTARQ